MNESILFSLLTGLGGGIIFILLYEARKALLLCKHGRKKKSCSLCYLEKK